MVRSGTGVIIFLLFLAGCAALEGPRWALLGDTSQEAYYLDRQDVQRLPNGNYRYPVKVCPYEEGKLHKLDENRDTNQVLFVEMNCREKRWTEAGRGTMDNQGKILFRHLTPFPGTHPVEPGTIHLAAYTYLCGDDDIAEQHNHQQ